jgi:hypothetical protein
MASITNEKDFKATSYQVGRVVHAISSDSDGNLIFADVPNPNGVTLTQLLNNLLGNSISFNSTNSFFSEADNVEEALLYLNQFAYLKDTGRFIYVDPTIASSKVSTGDIYNNLADAISYAQNLITNGHNSINIMVMGSHKQQGSLEQSSDLGVHEITYSGTFSPIKLKKNGIRLIGVGQPVIRLKNFTGTLGNRLSAFEVDTDGVLDKVRILVQDISFEMVNCTHTSVFNVKNAPINNATKERNGFKIEKASISFYGGSHNNNRLVDVSTTDIEQVSSVLINDLEIGSISNTTPSTDEIQLVYVDHHDDTVVCVNNMNFGSAGVPNSQSNADNTMVTSFTALTAVNGRVVCNNCILDEKFYWNGTSFASVITKLVKCFNSSIVSINNLGIIRNSYNTLQEDAGGITTIQDWISVNDSAKLTVTGFDEVFSCDVQSQPTTSVGTSSTSTSGTIIDVKPVKSFWNGQNIALGIGHKNELRLGQITDSDAEDFVNYNIDTYGIPFWYNSDKRKLQFFNGLEVSDVGKGKVFSIDIDSSAFAPTSYSFSGEATFLGFEVIINHNLDLENRLAFTITVAETVTGRIVQPQEVLAVNSNRITLIMGDSGDYTVTIVGF